MRIEAVVAFVFAVTAITASTVVGCVGGMVLVHSEPYARLVGVLTFGSEFGTVVVRGLTFLGSALGLTAATIRWTNQFDEVRHLWARIDGF
ncbi:hypothetical protein [Halomarina rubra]|uniref:Uncharacterized protein n=1 Tax=Halomarina rubra TaxID=2071873 RepID=A0ABD6AZM1_9EURY|nr:hypothetical protein [Halomarina rubra]